MRLQNVSTYNPVFTNKKQNIRKFGKNLVPVLKVSAEPAKEPPKTLLEKLGYGLKYIIDRLYYYCFCKR